jgi:hypothetical protein
VWGRLGRDLLPRGGKALPFQTINGNKRYARLVSFRALNDAEPIAAKAKKAIRA